MGKLFNNGSTYNGTFTHFSIPPQTRTITTFLPSANSFIDAQKASNNVECDWKFYVCTGQENWSIQSGDDYSILKSDLGTNSTVLPAGSTDIVCGRFATVGSATKVGDLWVGGNYVNIFGDASAMDLNGWKAKLAKWYADGDPLVLFYKAPVTVTTVTISELTQPLGTVTILNEFADGTKGAVDFYGVNIDIQNPSPKPEEPYPLLSNAGEVSYGQWGSNLIDNQNAYNTNGMCPGVTTRWGWILPLEVGDYTLRGFFTPSAGIGLYYRLSTDDGASWGDSNGISDNNEKFFITVPSKIVVYGGSGDLNKNKMAAKNVTMVKGRTTLTEPIPYHFGWHGDGQQTVKMESVNLFDGGEYGSYSSTTGEKIDNPTKFRSKNKIPVVAGQTYSNNIINKPSWLTVSTLNIYGYDAQGEFLWAGTSSVNAWSMGRPFTMPENTAYITVSTFGTDVNTAERVAELNEKFIIVEGSVAPTSYQPYVAPQTRTTSEILPSATSKMNMQGGNDNKDCDWAFKQLDGTENWSYSSTAVTGHNVFTLSIADTSRDNDFSPLSTAYKGVPASTPFTGLANGQFKHASSSSTYYFVDDRFDNVTAFKAWLAEAKPIIAYKLATSLKSTVQTTPFDIPKKTTYVLSSQAVDGQALDVQAMCVSE